MSACPKMNIVRDKSYREWLKTQPCILTGQLGNDTEVVDPCHIGTLGKGIKSPDNECLPVLHRFHAEGHGKGEISMFRKRAPDWLLREALRAYARELYRQWKQP